MRPHALVPLSLLLVLACGPTLADPDQEESQAGQEGIEFTFSADPTVEVLQVMPPYGAFIGGTTVCTLFGDGRLEITVGTPTKVRTTRQANLSYEEAEDLVRLALEHGLMDIDTKGLERKIVEANDGKSVRAGVDAGVVQVQINLESYSRGGTPGPLTNTLRLKAPDVRKRYVPDVLEIQGLTLLAARCVAHRNAAEDSDEAPHE